MSDSKSLTRESFVVEVIYGYATLNSWFEFDGDKFIGMGSSTFYDRDGIVTKRNVGPSGVNFRLF